MGRSIALSVLVAVVCAIIIWGLGRMLDSSTLSSVAIAGGAGAESGISSPRVVKVAPDADRAGTSRRRLDHDHYRCANGPGGDHD